MMRDCGFEGCCLISPCKLNTSNAQGNKMTDCSFWASFTWIQSGNSSELLHCPCFKFRCLSVYISKYDIYLYMPILIPFSSVIWWIHFLNIDRSSFKACCSAHPLYLLKRCIYSPLNHQLHSQIFHLYEEKRPMAQRKVLWFNETVKKQILNS